MVRDVTIAMRHASGMSQRGFKCMDAVQTSEDTNPKDFCCPGKDGLFAFHAPFTKAVPTEQLVEFGKFLVIFGNGRSKCFGVAVMSHKATL